MFGLTTVLRGLGEDLGFLQIVIGGCVLLYLGGLVLTARLYPDRLQEGGGGFLGFLAPAPEIQLLFGASGAYPVLGLRRWWTVLSAAWLHGGLLHIAFNLMSARNLIPAMAVIFGPGRTVIIYCVSSIVGFGASSLAGAFLPNIPFLRGAAFTVGASASIFGLIGALVHYGSRASSAIKEQAVGWALSGVVMGFMLPGIDNWAHLGGFVGGYLTSKWLNPLLPERGDHVLAAVWLLGLSFASVVVSILAGLKYFR
jgi:rhomboid protease GluP